MLSMTSCFNSYIYFRLGISELDLHLPSLFFVCELSLPLILKSPLKLKCITLKNIHALILSLRELRCVMSGEKCLWMINYFSIRSADREINTSAWIRALIWELMRALGDGDAQGRLFQEGWLWSRSRKLFLPPEHSTKRSEMLFCSA